MKGSFILSLETAVEGGSLAILECDGSVTSLNVPSRASRTEEILRAISQALKGSGRSVDKITGIAVSAGPGSFTGIRIGLATANGLARAVGAPVFAYSLMMVLAAKAPEHDLVVAVIPMGRGSVCIQEFQKHGGTTSELAPPRSIPRCDLIRYIDSHASIVVHGSLISEFAHENVINAGHDMAGLVAYHYKEYGPRSTPPLFVSKN